MLFRQLFDPETSTYSYLLADADTREAVLIDSVFEQVDRDRTLLRELDLTLLHAVETHVHADHVTASGLLRESPGAQIVVGARTGVTNADVSVAKGDRIRFGRHELEALPTPGHTDGCTTYVCAKQGMAFTGDALLVRGCGRTDFQQGDPRELFASVRKGIFALPDATLLYPAHDYKGHHVTTVREEKRFNRRLSLDHSEAEFEAIMKGLDLAHPKRIDVAVPANLNSGVGYDPARDGDEAAPSVSDVMDRMGRQDAGFMMGGGI